MVPEVLEKATVMELQVRMDCNGCVQKIKKAMHNIDGVYDVNINFAEQKLTVVGRADPEKILKAIKKTRKAATICSHTEPPPPEEPAPAPTPSEPPPPPPAPEPESPAKEEEKKEEEEVKPSTEEAEAKDVKEVVHMVHYYPENGPYCSVSSNSYRPPVYVSSGYGFGRPRLMISGGGEAYHDDDDQYYYTRNYHSTGGDGNSITSVFSDENPHACTIV